MLVTPFAKPSVIPKEARLRELLSTSLPLKQKRAQSFIVGDSSSFVVGMTKKKEKVVGMMVGVVAPPALPNVIPKEVRLRNLLRIGLPLTDKREFCYRS